ncbi:hypothetical protein [Cystobacter fuscus]|uniref:hypothetical protein n=1 Tax=Cystobacter fuscus TaxID=43 RepID=UPI00138B064D|nr:hypothetical protein [Cystobacter fuscus]
MTKELGADSGREEHVPNEGIEAQSRMAALMSSVYHKVYLSGGGEERRVEVSATEFHALKEEAESLWGTTDLQGDFVPGLLNRKLPLVERQDDVRMD